MSCIVQDIELAVKNDIEELGVFIDRNVQEYPFRPPRKYQPTKQEFWCTRNLHGIVWSSGRLDYNELAGISPRVVYGEPFARGTEKCKILGNFFDKEVENLQYQCSPKVLDLFDEEMWICLIKLFSY